MKYVLYFRVSTDKQGKSGLGLEAQQRDIVVFLQNYANAGDEIVGEFTDIDSGGNDNRPELTKALALSRRSEATLLVAKLDRLSRDVAFIATLLKDKKVTLRVAAMPHADKFQLHIYAALAEQEREFISLRTKAALQSARERGVKLGGMRAGTRKKNVAAKDEADRRAETLCGVILPLRTSHFTLAEVAATLNAANIQTVRGCRWTPKQVSRIIQRLGAA